MAISDSILKVDFLFSPEEDEVLEDLFPWRLRNGQTIWLNHRALEAVKVSLELEGPFAWRMPRLYEYEGEFLVASPDTFLIELAKDPASRNNKGPSIQKLADTLNDLEEAYTGKNPKVARHNVGNHIRRNAPECLGNGEQIRWGRALQILHPDLGILYEEFYAPQIVEHRGLDRLIIGTGSSAMNAVRYALKGYDGESVENFSGLLSPPEYDRLTMEHRIRFARSTALRCKREKRGFFDPEHQRRIGKMLYAEGKGIFGPNHDFGAQGRKNALAMVREGRGVSALTPDERAAILARKHLNRGSVPWMYVQEYTIDGILRIVPLAEVAYKKSQEPEFRQGKRTHISRLRDWFMESVQEFQDGTLPPIKNLSLSYAITAYKKKLPELRRARQRMNTYLGSLGLKELKGIQNLEYILQDLDREVIDGTVIDGGHYLIEENRDGTLEHNVDPRSLASFIAAVSLYQRSRTRGKKVDLSFLVADLGVTDNRESFRANYELPEIYQQILKNYDVDAEEVTIYFESNWRNRARTKMKKKLKEGQLVVKDRTIRLPIDFDNVTYEDLMRQPDHAMSNAPEDPSDHVPVCRTILAQGVADKVTRGATKLINFYNQSTIRCSGHGFKDIAREVYDVQVPIINVFFQEKQLEVQKFR